MKFFYTIICGFYAIFVCNFSFAGEIKITVECGNDKFVITSEKPISISQIVHSIEKSTANCAVNLNAKLFKFAAFPVLCMKFHNKNADTNMWLCVSDKKWAEYEIEKECTVVLLKTLAGYKIPRTQNWFFDSDSKEQADN